MMEWNENPKQGGKGTAFLRPDGHLCSWLQAIHPPQTRKLTGRAGKSTMNESVDAFPMGKSGIFQLVIRFFFPGCLVMKKHPQVWWVLAISLLVLEGLKGWGKTTKKKAFCLSSLCFLKTFFYEGLQKLPFKSFLWCFSLCVPVVFRCFSLLFPPLSSPPCRCPVRHGSTFWAWQWTGLTVALAWAHDWCRARCRWLSSSMPGRRCSTWGWFFLGGEDLETVVGKNPWW